MKLNITSDKCVSAQSAVNVFVFEETRVIERGECYLSLFLNFKQSDENTASEARNLFSDVSNKFFSQENITAENLREITQSITKEEHHLEVGIVTIENNQINASLKGELALSLYRDGKLVDLIRPTPLKISTVSGKLNKGDVVFSMTSAMKEEISTDLKRVLLENKGKNELVDFVNQKTASVDGTNALAMQAIFISKKPAKAFKLRPKIVNALDGVINLVSRKNTAVGAQTYEAGRKSKTKYASRIGIALLLALGVSIAIGIKRRDVKLARQEYEPQLIEAKHNLTEARELADLSPPRARELVLGSKSVVENLSEQGVEDKELDALRGEVERSLSELAGIYESDQQLFLDLTLISSGFEGKDIDLSDGLIRVLDGNGKRLAGVEIETKRTEIITGPEFLPDAIQTSGYTDRSFILSSDGVREVTDDVELVVKPEWKADNVLIYAFAGNLYVLDRETSMIFRYPGTSGGFLEGEEWLASDINVDLSDSRAWSIDGFIWVLTDDSSINQYSLGILRNFSISGVEPEISDAVDIYTSDETDSIYILDKGNSRIVVIGKEGQFQAEYVQSGLGDASKLVASEDANRIVYLSDSKLYEIEIRH